MSKSKIEWTNETWNPCTGCTKVSAGCKNCYAAEMSRRLKYMHPVKYRNGFELTCHPSELERPYKWRKPRVVFVNSMSDLFHEGVPLDFIKQVFEVMNGTPHTYQILTKRSERLAELSCELSWTDNIWMGVSVENQAVLNRLDDLKKCGARIKFLSCEPLLEGLPNMELNGIDWVIAGGESGRNARPIKEEWVIDIKQQCEKSGTKFFFKQWGGTNKKKTGRMLNGRTFDEMPE